RLPGQRTRAVRCFLSPAPGRMMRYKAIHDHLALFALPFVVRFGYVEEGILVNGGGYPVVEMDWVEGGLTLNAFVGQPTGNPPVLAALAERWLRLAQELRDAGVAHGDLQNGNVLIVPDGDGFDVRLIDYDGTYVPALAVSPPDEVGHRDYQHPRRQVVGSYGA